MSIELRTGRDGKLRSSWYGRALQSAMQNWAWFKKWAWRVTWSLGIDPATAGLWPRSAIADPGQRPRLQDQPCNRFLNHAQTVDQWAPACALLRRGREDAERADACDSGPDHDKDMEEGCWPAPATGRGGVTRRARRLSC